jgi:hypothetical protein
LLKNGEPEETQKTDAYCAVARENTRYVDNPVMACEMHFHKAAHKSQCFFHFYFFGRIFFLLGVETHRQDAGVTTKKTAARIAPGGGAGKLLFIPERI